MPASSPIKLPRIVVLAALVVLILAAHRYYPRVFWLVIGLVVLYDVLTNMPRALELIGGVPQFLGRSYVDNTPASRLHRNQ